MEVGGGGRRRHSLSDEDIDSPNLQEDSHFSGGQTLAAVLSQKRQPEANRTLLDIIRDDPSGTHHRKTWRTFKDKIRLRRAGSAWTSSVHVPASDVPIPSSNRMMSRRQSTRFPTTTVADDLEDQSPEINRPGINSMPSSRGMMMRHNSSRLPNLANTSYAREVEFSTSFNTSKDRVRVHDEDEDEDEDEEEDDEEERESEEESSEPQVRMSLMALLAETDREMGLDGSPFMMGDDDEEDEDEEEDEVSSGAGEYNTCCVCMVRHKGAAFVPCGHTFCRLCSKELWVQKGNCPLCNKFILEILDIF